MNEVEAILFGNQSHPSWGNNPVVQDEQRTAHLHQLIELLSSKLGTEKNIDGDIAGSIIGRPSLPNKMLLKYSHSELQKDPQKVKQTLETQRELYSLLKLKADAQGKQLDLSKIDLSYADPTKQAGEPGSPLNRNAGIQARKVLLLEQHASEFRKKVAQGPYEIERSNLMRTISDLNAGISWNPWTWESPQQVEEKALIALKDAQVAIQKDPSFSGQERLQFQKEINTVLQIKKNSTLPSEIYKAVSNIPIKAAEILGNNPGFLTELEKLQIRQESEAAVKAAARANTAQKTTGLPGLGGEEAAPQTQSAPVQKQSAPPTTTGGSAQPKATPSAAASKAAPKAAAPTTTAAATPAAQSADAGLTDAQIKLIEDYKYGDAITPELAEVSKILRSRGDVDDLLNKAQVSTGRSHKGQSDKELLAAFSKSENRGKVDLSVFKGAANSAAPTTQLSGQTVQLANGKWVDQNSPEGKARIAATNPTAPNTPPTAAQGTGTNANTGTGTNTNTGTGTDTGTNQTSPPPAPDNQTPPPPAPDKQKMSDAFQKVMDSMEKGDLKSQLLTGAGLIQDMVGLFAGLEGMNKDMTEYKPSQYLVDMVAHSKRLVEQGLPETEEEYMRNEAKRGLDLQMGVIKANAGGSGGAVLGNAFAASRDYYDAISKIDQADINAKMAAIPYHLTALEKMEQAHLQKYLDRRDMEIARTNAASKLVSSSLENAHKAVQYEQGFGKGSVNQVLAWSKLQKLSNEEKIMEEGSAKMIETIAGGGVGIDPKGKANASTNNVVSNTGLPSNTAVNPVTPPVSTYATPTQNPVQ